MRKEYELLKKVSEVQGISGDEREVAMLIKEELKDIATFEYDNLGSTIAYLNKDSDLPKILLTGHMDEVGFIVSNITPNGFIKMSPIGGWWNHVLLAEVMVLKTRDGRKYFGVIGAQPPHGMPAEARSRVMELNNIYLDLGIKDKKMAEDLGIRMGDTITPYQEFRVLNDGVSLLGKAWDDRIAVAAGIEILRKLKERNSKANAIFAGTVQEEVGLRGAKTASYHVNPDIAFAIDVTMSHDLPGSDAGFDTKLGAGVALSVKDGSVIAHRGLFDFVEEIAKKHNIKYTYDFLQAGGTDSGEMHKQYNGIINMTISLPCRYFHSHVSIINYEDYENTINLMVEVIESITAETVAKLKASKYE